MDDLLTPHQTPRVYLPAYGLWLVSVVLSALVFITGREMVIRTYVRFFPGEQESLSLLNILVSFPLAALVIAIIIGGFEYQHRNMGKPEAWWLLARTLAVESGILLLAWYI